MKFSKIEGNSIVCSDNGLNVKVPVSQQTQIRVQAPGTAEFLVPGSIVEIHGKSDASFTINKPQISIYAGRLAPRQRSAYGSYYLHEAKRAEQLIPVTLVGTIVATEPLRVKGGNSIQSQYYFDDEKDANSNYLNNYHDFPVLNQIFTVDPDSDRIYMELGNAVQLAKEGDNVHVYYSKDRQYVRTIYIYLNDPPPLESLGIKPKATKVSKKKVTKRTTATKKSTQKKSSKKDDSDDKDDADDDTNN